MDDSTVENGWGLPSAAFFRSLCPPLPPPWPPQRPDLIPPWQDPVERQRAAQAGAEAERARAEQEETLQFIRDYVQALRDWRKEIVFHWGDHVIGRTTISLFKNPPAGEPAQPSLAQPTVGGTGTVSAGPDRGSPVKLDISFPAVTTPALIGPAASAKVADPTIQASDPPSTSIDLVAAHSEEVPTAPDGGRSAIAMTDMVVKDNGSKGNLGTASRPAAEAVAGPCASAAIPATIIAADGLWAPPSLLPALPSAETILAGLAAVIGSPITIAATTLGGILLPTRTAADDTLDGTPFAAVPPPPNTLPGGAPVRLPALPPLAVPTQADRGPVILPGGEPVSLPPLLPFPDSQDAQGPLIFPGSPDPVQLPTVVQNEAADAPNNVVGAAEDGMLSQPLDWSRVNPQGENAVDHVNLHGADNLRKPIQGVFSGDPIATANTAWEKAQATGIQPVVQANGNLVYDVPIGTPVGWQGGYNGTGAPLSMVRIVTTPTGQMVTAFPK